jgi:heat shock factor-binding protein 1|tara:strand:- start:984 stop:1154 length:171 start_codon:yes stop_codon:yes gene_type:complete
MQSRFQTMSDSIITRIDEMGERIDDLERSVQDLVTQADGAEDGSAAPTNALAKPGQ